MKDIEPCGLYIISDRYFSDYPNERYMDNKKESRPHYYAIRDNDGILWMIPLSSKVEKYKVKIENTERIHGSNSCILCCIVPIHGTDRAVLICDMFPITDEYILRAFTIDGVPYVIQNKNIQKAIHKRAMRYLSLVKRGVLKSSLNILETREKLLEKKSSC